MKRIFVLALVLLFLTGCTQNISKNTAAPVTNPVEQDRIVQQLESEHFIFYSKEKDKECIEALASTLSDSYARISEDLGVTLSKKVNIYVYSDLDTFHSAINQPDAPDWVVGIALPGTTTIKMVNPLNVDSHSYDSMLKVMVHEFTHIVTMNINPKVYSLPLWLSEGIAMFEAGQTEGVNEWISTAKASDKFPTLKELESGSYTFGNIGGYQFSYSIIEYMVKNYGYDKVIALIKSPTEFEEIFGLSKEAFQKEWIEYLN